MGELFWAVGARWVSSPARKNRRTMGHCERTKLLLHAHCFGTLGDPIEMKCKMQKEKEIDLYPSSCRHKHMQHQFYGSNNHNNASSLPVCSAPHPSQHYCSPLTDFTGRDAAIS